LPVVAGVAAKGGFRHRGSEKREFSWDIEGDVFLNPFSVIHKVDQALGTAGFPAASFA
jgi:hypothetical protein